MAAVEKAINPDSPYDGAAAVTPDNATLFSKWPSRALYVGGGGNLSIVFEDDSVASMVGVPTGTTLRVKAKRVNATGTTATNIVALY